MIQLVGYVLILANMDDNNFRSSSRDVHRIAARLYARVDSHQIFVCVSANPVFLLTNEKI